MKTATLQSQFSFADFNPDCMSIDEMHAWLSYIGRGKRPACASVWFPGVSYRFSLVGDLRNYLWNKLTATSCRLDGNIANAFRYELICETIYKGLPDFARW